MQIAGQPDFSSGARVFAFSFLFSDFDSGLIFRMSATASSKLEDTCESEQPLRVHRLKPPQFPK